MLRRSRSFASIFFTGLWNIRVDALLIGEKSSDRGEIWRCSRLSKSSASVPKTPARKAGVLVNRW
jgi:hypothetical protein